MAGVPGVSGSGSGSTNPMGSFGGADGSSGGSGGCGGGGKGGKAPGGTQGPGGADSTGAAGGATPPSANAGKHATTLQEAYANLAEATAAQDPVGVASAQADIKALSAAGGAGDPTLDALMQQVGQADPLAAGATA